MLFPLLRHSPAMLKELAELHCRIAEVSRQRRTHPHGSIGATACRAKLASGASQAPPLFACRLLLVLLGLEPLEEDTHALGEEGFLRGGGPVTLELFLSLRCLVDGRVLLFCHEGFLLLNTT